MCDMWCVEWRWCGGVVWFISDVLVVLYLLSYVVYCRALFFCGVDEFANSARYEVLATNCRAPSLDTSTLLTRAVLCLRVRRDFRSLDWIHNILFLSLACL